MFDAYLRRPGRPAASHRAQEAVPTGLGLRSGCIMSGSVLQDPWTVPVPLCKELLRNRVHKASCSSQPHRDSFQRCYRPLLHKTHRVHHRLRSWAFRSKPNHFSRTGAPISTQGRKFLIQGAVRLLSLQGLVEKQADDPLKTRKCCMLIWWDARSQ
jgi:hypothetical protein